MYKRQHLTVLGVGDLIPHNLHAGWNSFEPWAADLGHTLSAVNSSLQWDSINFTMITFAYSNGTQVSLVWIQATNTYFVEDPNKTVTLTCTIWIYCKEAGVWLHTYES